MIKSVIASVRVEIVLEQNMGNTGAQGKRKQEKRWKLVRERLSRVFIVLYYFECLFLPIF